MPVSKSSRRRISSEYHEIEATREALLAAHSAPDFDTRWVNVARTLCRARPKVDAEDLLQETLTRIWSGGRRWPADIDWDVFFFMVMLSTYSNLRLPLRRVDSVDDFDRIASGYADHAREASERHLMEHFLDESIVDWLRRAFGERPLLFGYARLRLAGASKREVMSILAVGEAQYNTLYNACKDRLRAEMRRLRARPRTP